MMEGGMCCWGVGLGDVGLASAAAGREAPLLLVMEALAPAVRAVCEAKALPLELAALVHASYDVSRFWSLADAAAMGLKALVIDRSKAEAPESIEAVDAMDLAAEFGHLEVVKWLHEHRSEGCSTNAMDLAASNGHLEVVRFLHDHRDEGCSSDAADLAAMGGRLEVVRFLHDHREEGCTTLAMDLAAANGHLEVVRWLHSHREEGCSAHALAAASANGHARVARWLLQFRQEGCVDTAAASARANGHEELAQWLEDRRFLRPEEHEESPELRELRRRVRMTVNAENW